MPRHPPCALKNKHTNHHTQTTQPTKRKPCSPHTAAKNELDKINTQEKITSHTQHHQTSGIMQMLASTIQFSHNTPTNKHTPPQQMTRINQPGTQTGTMPQTPNNAPTYNKHSFSYTWTLFTHVTKHHSHTRHYQLRCISYPEIYNNWWQQNTRPLNHQPTHSGFGLQLQPTQ